MEHKLAVELECVAASPNFERLREPEGPFDGHGGAEPGDDATRAAVFVFDASRLQAPHNLRR